MNKILSEMVGRVNPPGGANSKKKSFRSCHWTWYACPSPVRNPVVPLIADKRLLIWLAWVNVIVHALALILSVVGLRPGSPLVEVPERLHYLSGHPLAWSLGWGSWMLCTLTLIVFFAALAEHLPEKSGAAPLAVVLSAVGGGIDLFCDVIYITVLPELASVASPPYSTFMAMERASLAGGLIVANGLYALGTLLLTLCFRGQARGRVLLMGTGYGVFGFGMVLVVAGFANDPQLAAIGTGPTIILFCLWTVLAARALACPEVRP
jgi:hypothetical protein